MKLILGALLKQAIERREAVIAEDSAWHSSLTSFIFVVSTTILLVVKP